MRCLVFDDLGALHTKVDLPHIEREVFGPTESVSLDDYFADHCAQKLRKWKAERHGIIVLYAHGRFSKNARRQDLQGVDLLKHIRLSPWLDHLSSWHAVVYSLESLEQILDRRPGNLVLTSPGVTILRLPESRALTEALRDARGNPDLSLEGLAKGNALLDRRSFRPFVACDYMPPDSAHETSNLWGLYEMWPTCLAKEFPEVEAAEELPRDVLAFVQSLTCKKARWLEGERPRMIGAAHKKTIESLPVSCKERRIALVDDEAENGWAQFLKLLVNGPNEHGNCSIWRPDPAKIRSLREVLISKTSPENLLHAISAEVRDQKPDFVILDLRLGGSAEFATPPALSTGMQLASILRASDPFLPVLLFTASNKAETLSIGNSYNIDEYWMKPGLGEHRGLGSRHADVISLAGKIEHLLGPDYRWLQRLWMELSNIETASETWWWEKGIVWPAPVRADGRQINRIDRRIIGAITSQPPGKGTKVAVIELLRPMLESLRIALRLEHRNVGEPAAPTPYLLRAGVFNQIGKVIELIHGFTEGGAVPDEFRKAGTVGGRKDAKDDCFVFFRQDWWAFRLFSQRNEWSHVRMIDQTNVFASASKTKVRGPSNDDVFNAISDLVAWLTLPRVEPQPKQVAANKSGRFRLSPQDRLASGTWTKVTSRAATSRDFQNCMADRQEYQQLITKAEDLKSSLRKVAKN